MHGWIRPQTTRGYPTLAPSGRPPQCVDRRPFGRFRCDVRLAARGRVAPRPADRDRAEPWRGPISRGRPPAPGEPGKSKRSRHACHCTTEFNAEHMLQNRGTPGLRNRSTLASSCTVTPVSCLSEHPVRGSGLMASSAGDPSMPSGAERHRCIRRGLPLDQMLRQPESERDRRQGRVGEA
jgi:hypothetical protein